MTSQDVSAERRMGPPILAGRDPYGDVSHERIVELEAQLGVISAELRGYQHDDLTRRDHIIGLEAEVTQLQSQLAQSQQKIQQQQARIKQLRQKVDNQTRRIRRIERSLAAVRTSRAWRIGRLLAGSRHTPEI